MDLLPVAIALQYTQYHWNTVPLVYTWIAILSPKPMGRYYSIVRGSDESGKPVRWHVVAVGAGPCRIGACPLCCTVVPYVHELQGRCTGVLLNILLRRTVHLHERVQFEPSSLVPKSGAGLRCWKATPVKHFLNAT